MTAARAKTISFNDVLARTDSSFKNLFDMGLLPQLEEKRIVPRGLKKSLESKREPARIPLLLGYLKNMKPEKFIDLLSILEQSSKEHEHEETRKNTKRLVEVMSTHVRNMFAYGGEKAEAVIQSFLSTADYYKELSQSHTAKTQHRLETIQTSTTESETTIAEVETTISTGAVSSLAPVDPVSLPPLRPPPGHMDDPPAQWFTREGGTLYSPIHGIEVVIPPDAPPLGVDKFWLSIHVYPRGPFVLPEGVVSCSPAVWFFLSPTFEFVKNVTLRIPHSARGSVSSDVCVYRMLTGKEGTKDPPFVLSEKVEGCECDWYHTTVHVRHFSPYRNGVSSDATSEAVHRTQPQSMKHSSKHPVATGLKHLAKQRSSSFEKDSDAPDQLTVRTQSIAPVRSTVNRYCITRGIPKDLSSTPWDAKFYVGLSHPTHIWQQVMKATSERDRVSLAHKLFHFTSNRLEFTRREVSEGWSVEPTDGEEITVDDLEFQSSMLTESCWKEEFETGSYPTTVTYHIDTDLTAPFVPRQLKCKIGVTGADRQLDYMLNSPPPSNQGKVSTRPASLTTSLHLYNEASLLVEQLSSGNPGLLRLNPAIDDHLRLITDISLQLSGPKGVARMLCIDDEQFSTIEHDNKSSATEQIFKLVYTWVSNEQPTIAELCRTLRVNGITLTNDENTSVFEGHRNLYGQCILPKDSLFLKLYRGLAGYSWRFVGRFLGLPDSSVITIAYNSPQEGQEQAYQMLKDWRERQGDNATYGHLFTAIQRLWSYDAMRPGCHDAYWCFTTYINEYNITEPV